MPTLKQRVPAPVKRLVVDIIRMPRFLTSPWRVLPDFLICGVQKGGTTSLYNYLAQHPCVKPSLVKEIHFFDGGFDYYPDRYARGVNWYRMHFPLACQMGEGFVAGEASHTYMFNPLARPRIQALLPRVKLIFLLRHPVERAISLYFMRRRQGFEQLPIMDAMRQEEARLAPALARRDYRHRDWHLYSYQARGRYAEQLRPFFEHFPREQILVIQSEVLFKQSAETVQRVLKFLEVPYHDFSLSLEAHNVADNKVPVEAAVIEYLNDYFAPYNEQLYQLLGERYNWQ